MKNLKLLFLIPIILLGILSVVISSCKKANREFIGTYVGKSKINGSSDINDTIVIVGDSANNSDIFVYDTLFQFRTLDNVSGNNISIPSQTVYVTGFAGNATFTGSGSLSGSTLSITYYYGTPMTTIAFTGTKQ